MEEEQREQREQKGTEQAARGGWSTTPYDDAWRTLTTTVPKLLIPMVNEVFGTHFTENAVVHLKQNEHMYSGMNGKTEKHITDTNFVIVDESLIDSILGSGFDIIEGEVAKHYVFECESKPVGPVVLVRIVEYSVKTAVESGTKKGKTKLTVHIPQTAILSLRSTANTPDEMQLAIVMESGSCSSTVRIMKLSNYDMESLFDKKLYLLSTMRNGLTRLRRAKRSMSRCWNCSAARLAGWMSWFPRMIFLPGILTCLPSKRCGQ